MIAITSRASGIQSDTIFKLASKDNWKNAQISKTFHAGNVYTTTDAAKSNKIFVDYGHLNTLAKSLKEDKDLIQNFRIQEIGTL